MSDRCIYYYYYYWVRTTVYLCTFPIPMRRKRFPPKLKLIPPLPLPPWPMIVCCYVIDVASTLRCINFFPVPLTDWYGANDRLQSDLREMLKSMTLTLKRSCRPHDLCSMLLFHLPLSLLLYFIFIHFSPLLGCCHPRWWLLVFLYVVVGRVCRSSDRGNEKRAAAANSRWMGFCSWSHSFLRNKSYTYTFCCVALVFSQ